PRRSWSALQIRQAVEPQTADQPDLAQRLDQLDARRVLDAAAHGLKDRALVVQPHTDDEWEAEPVAIGAVEGQEQGVLLLGEVIETRARLFARGIPRQAPVDRQLVR